MSASDPTLRTFAEEHRLRTRRDEDHTLIAVGRLAKTRPGVRRISDFGDGCLHFSIHNPANLEDEYRLSERGWTYVKRRCLAAGMELHQNGYGEGSLLFGPSDPEQVEQAVEESGAQKRAVSEAMGEAGRKNIEKAQAAHPDISGS